MFYSNALCFLSCLCRALNGATRYRLNHTKRTNLIQLFSAVDFLSFFERALAKRHGVASQARIEISAPQ